MPGQLKSRSQPPPRSIQLCIYKTTLRSLDDCRSSYPFEIMSSMISLLLIKREGPTTLIGWFVLTFNQAIRSLSVNMSHWSPSELKWALPIGWSWYIPSLNLNHWSPTPVLKEPWPTKEIWWSALTLNKYVRAWASTRAIRSSPC